MVTNKGVTPVSWSLDHAGPMARSVEDMLEKCSESISEPRDAKQMVRRTRIGES